MIVSISIGWNPNLETYFMQIQMEPWSRGPAHSHGTLFFSGRLDALLELLKLITIHLQREG